MKARAKRNVDTVSARVSAAIASPARSLGAERGSLEARLGGGNLSALRLHRGPNADAAARLIGARGFTLGRHVALSDRADPGTLTHEAAHALQQDMAEPARGQYPIGPANDPAEREAERAASAGGPLRRGLGLRIQRDLDDPGRLGTVHENVRVQGPPRSTPSGGTATRLPWVDPTPSSGGTAELLFNQAHAFLDARTFQRQEPDNTTEANLDADAVAMHQRVVDRFPQITSRLSDAEIQRRVGLFEPSTIRNNRNFLGQWMDNFLDQLAEPTETSAADFAIDTNNLHYRAMIDRLIDDPDVGPKIVTLAARQSAFTRGEGANREVFVHRRVEADARRLTLIHEITHFYRHPRYAAWVQASQSERHYNEGMTEWLARKVMTAGELADRSNYQARVNTVESQIAAHVPEDGIARAFFRGEVWRLETRSPEAREAFEAGTGIREGAPTADEGAASRAGSGLFQTVRPGTHFRFLNLGRDEAQPKSEHEAAFRTVKTDRLDSDTALKLRFVGHASGPGSEATNRNLSRRRSVAFYRMARREGVPWSRMIDADRPPHFGESAPTVTEEDAITRAMNRRVEMFLIRRGTP